MSAVRVDTADLAASPEVELYPGMPATVMIKTNERTTLDCIFGAVLGVGGQIGEGGGCRCSQILRVALSGVWR